MSGIFASNAKIQQDELWNLPPAMKINFFFANANIVYTVQ
jgi:hypothetical protein